MQDLHCIVHYVHACACNWEYTQLWLACVYTRVSLNLWLHGTVGLQPCNNLMSSCLPCYKAVDVQQPCYKAAVIYSSLVTRLLRLYYLVVAMLQGGISLVTRLSFLYGYLAYILKAIPSWPLLALPKTILGHQYFCKNNYILVAHGYKYMNQSELDVYLQYTNFIVIIWRLVFAIA